MWCFRYQKPPHHINCHIFMTLSFWYHSSRLLVSLIFKDSWWIISNFVRKLSRVTFFHPFFPLAHLNMVDVDLTIKSSRSRTFFMHQEYHISNLNDLFTRFHAWNGCVSVLIVFLFTMTFDASHSYYYPLSLIYIDIVSVCFSQKRHFGSPPFDRQWYGKKLDFEEKREELFNRFDEKDNLFVSPHKLPTYRL